MVLNAMFPDRLKKTLYEVDSEQGYKDDVVVRLSQRDMMWCGWLGGSCARKCETGASLPYV
jgi:hypothetical protein